LANFILVIGVSGNGKSSVVRAGLIPLLKESGWTVLEPIKLETKPLAELRAALKQIFQDAQEIQHLDACIDELPDGLNFLNFPSSEWFLLVVAQFEEVLHFVPKKQTGRGSFSF